MRCAVALLAASTLAFTACGATGTVRRDARRTPPSPVREGGVIAADHQGRRYPPLLDDLEKRTFSWFWDFANPRTGLIPDRAPMNGGFCSIASQGFGLTAYAIGAERGYVTRDAAKARVKATLDFLAGLPQGPQATGVAGWHGLFYHFLDLETGYRLNSNVELSTIDTALLMYGVLTVGAYFDRDDPIEAAIRAQAEFLYRRVEWNWATPRSPLISMGWYPETASFHHLDWHGYNEAMLLYVLAIGSPTHPVDPSAWGAYTATYNWATFEGQQYVQFAPLFGHQFTAVWIDFRGLSDPFLDGHGIDYAENTRRATLAHRAYAMQNSPRWRDYGSEIWGFSACDGPGDFTATIDGISRRFMGYAARGASIDDTRDDGTIAPYAAGASIAFTPDESIAALNAMSKRYGTDVYGPYGFVDSFNPTIQNPALPFTHGRVVSGKGWFDTDGIGIDQGPLVGMLENHRSGLVWRLLRNNPYLISGLRRAGFHGGWLDQAP